MEITDLLTLSVEKNASDLHLSAGIPPRIRVDGDLQSLDLAALDDHAMQHLLYEFMDVQQRKIFEKQFNIDFCYEIPELARFRVNIFRQHRGMSAVLRTIPSQVMSLEQLKLPEIFKTLAQAPRGLVLVTGPTGSGKSTTLAAMLDYLNTQFFKHIISIEDPIEFVHQSKKCLFSQREVHRDTLSFSDALRSALREDPDIILIGELRDLETIRLALTAAETGHLVFATLHTTSAAKTINRIVDVFPSDEKSIVRTMLSESLNAVISQQLVKRIDGGRIAAHEILICNTAIRNLIREDKVAQMVSTMQTGQAHGMHTLEQHLNTLLQNQEIDEIEAQRVTGCNTLLR